MILTYLELERNGTHANDDLCLYKVGNKPVGDCLHPPEDDLMDDKQVAKTATR